MLRPGAPTTAPTCSRSQRRRRRRRGGVIEQPDGRGRLTWELAPEFTGHGSRRGRAAARRLRLRRARTWTGSRRCRPRRRARRSGSRPAPGCVREGVLRGQPGRRRRAGGPGRAGAAAPRTRRPTEPTGFRALLNSFLPRKRAIGQMLVRDPRRAGCCCAGSPTRTTGTCPAASSRSTSRRGGGRARGRGGARACSVDAGPLLLTDWLPPWSGWDDALCLVFDGGVRDPSVLEDAVLQAREIRSAQFCTARRGPRALRRLHRPADRGGAAHARRARRPGVHRVRPGLTPPPPSRRERTKSPRRVGANARKAPVESARTHGMPAVESARTHGNTGRNEPGGACSSRPETCVRADSAGSEDLRSRRLDGVQTCVRADSAVGQNRAEASPWRPLSTRGSSLPTAAKRPSRCVRAWSFSAPAVRRTRSISRVKASST